MRPTTAAINGNENIQKNGSRGASVKTARPPKKAKKPESLYGEKSTGNPNGNAYEIMAATRAVGTSAWIARSHQGRPALPDALPEVVAGMINNLVRGTGGGEIAIR
jgi:hypothetical protein